MRKLLILVLFAAMPLSSVLAKEGLLNSSFEEVASVLGKPARHDNGNVSGIQYDRYHFETRGWRAASAARIAHARAYTVVGSTEAKIADGSTTMTTRREVVQKRIFAKGFTRNSSVFLHLSTSIFIIG